MKKVGIKYIYGYDKKSVEIHRCVNRAVSVRVGTVAGFLFHVFTLFLDFPHFVV